MYINITAAWAVDREFVYIVDSPRPSQRVSQGSPRVSQGSPTVSQGSPRVSQGGQVHPDTYRGSKKE